MQRVNNLLIYTFINLENKILYICNRNFNFYETRNALYLMLHNVQFFLSQNEGILNSMFLCPCIFSIFVNDGQTFTSILVYSFIPNQLYMFRGMSLLIIRSAWLYFQHLILSTVIAAGWCHGWYGREFHLIHDTSQQQ
jgi:hypothetical protein